MSEKSHIGVRIKEVRGQHSLSQEDLAAVIGVSRQSVFRYESGAASPDSASIGKLCSHYDIDANWLLLGQGEPHFSPAKALGEITRLSNELASAREKVQQLESRLERHGLALEEERDLATLNTLAKKGTMGRTWRVWNSVLPGPASGLNGSEIQAQLAGQGYVITHEELEIELTLLTQLGLVFDDGDRYRATEGFSRLEARSVGDRFELAREAFLTIYKEILPTTLRDGEDKGVIGIAVGKVPEGRGQDVVRGLYSALRKTWEDSVPERGNETVVLAFGICKK